MLCNVLGMLCNVLSRPRHALQRLRHAFARSLADLGMLLQGPRSPTSKRKPPTCCLISCEAKGVVYHKVSQLIRQQVGGFSLRCGTPRTLQKHAQDLAKHAEVGRGRCQACLGRCKACLHILGTHNFNSKTKFCISGEYVINTAQNLNALFIRTNQQFPTTNYN